MAIVTLILGNSGEGKSYSLKHLDPSQTGVINVVNKPLPFRGGKDFKKLATDSAPKICDALVRSKAPVIVIDDFQYIMSLEYIRGNNQKYEKGAAFDRYNILSYNAFSVFDTAINHVSNDKRVYILAHLQEDNGRQRIKTMGKVLDDKIVLEGLVSTVLQTTLRDDGHFFMTQNNGFNTVKSPEDMFQSELIPNDLNAVDDAICEYYGIAKNPNQQPEQA
ncbi:ATP-binding protein [Psychrobacter sp. Marseille-P5312]|uniref:ATP-binding protein n=1 Tax=Psychrobacter sp. Marseille-P5312 TaxID=2086574 RepID=UPI000CF6DA73|nr:ATP-binding protein [Psychrobacter sp. Marseille-P5312]